MNPNRNRLYRKIATVTITGLFIFAVIIPVLIFLPQHSGAAENWYNNSWHYRKAITIDHTKVSNTDQSNFPVLINWADSDLQAHARSDGHDILFTDSTGIEKYPMKENNIRSVQGR
jgi:hypothetical protein